MTAVDVVPHRADELLLVVAGSVVGRMRDATIRVGAFASEHAAIDAALRADHRADGRTDAGAVRLVHDGAYEWVVAGRRPVARLLRPDAPFADGRAGGFALEFVVPATMPAPARVALARDLVRACGDASNAR